MCRTQVGRERHLSDSTLRQITQLSKLSFPELQERWRSLFGGEPPAYQRRFLVKRLAYRIQELAYGRLSEATRAGRMLLSCQVYCGFPQVLGPSGRGTTRTDHVAG